MTKNRLEAFSDGVIAIIITIMVLELHIPSISKAASGKEITAALLHVLPGLAAYLLSYVVIAVFWLNHHMLFEKINLVNSRVLWHNALLLFTMSLIPLPTAFMADHLLLPQAVMLYDSIMSINALAFLLLRRYAVKAGLIPHQAIIQRSNLASTLLYLAAVPLALVSVYISFIIFVLIPVWYFIPDKLHHQTSTT